MNLSDSYLKTRDYAESLKYSRQALPLAAEVLTNGEAAIGSFNEGLAYIGLGDIKQGEKLAEGAIAQAIEGDNLLDAQELLREYAERVGARRLFDDGDPGLSSLRRDGLRRS